MVLGWSEAPGNWIAFGSALVTLGFGVFVGYLGRFRGINLAFLMFEGGWGLRNLVSNAADIFEMPVSWLETGHPVVVVGTAITLAASVLWVWGLVWLARIFPRQELRANRWENVTLFGVMAVGVALVLAANLAYFNSPAWQADVAPITAAARPAYYALVVESVLVFEVAISLMAALGVVLAMRFVRTAPADHDLRSQIGLVAVALTLYPGAYGSWAWSQTFSVGGPARLAGFASVLLPAVLAAAVWLRACEKGVDSRMARRVAVYIVLAPLVGTLLSLLPPPGFSPSGPVRLIAVGLFGYAIIRHQMLGIDVKVRWAVSKSTVAAVFIVVFFAVSEGATEFFGQRTGSTYWGIAAAGALLFAIAPLQRVADHLAARAVPAASPVEKSQARQVYEHMARRLMADGELSADDEMALAHLADQVGLGSGPAHQIVVALLGETGARRTV